MTYAPGEPPYSQTPNENWYLPSSGGINNAGQQLPNQSYYPGGQGVPAADNYQPFQPIFTPPTKRRRGGVIVIPLVLLMILITLGVVFKVYMALHTSTPKAVAQSFVTAVMDNNSVQACSNALVQSRSACETNIQNIQKGLGSGGSMHFTIGGDAVSGNEAIVAFTGKICLSGGECLSNTNPNVGLPASGGSFLAAWNHVMLPRYHDSLFNVLCIFQSGRWYIYVPSGSNSTNSGNSGNSGVSTNSGNSGNSGNNLIK